MEAEEQQRPAYDPTADEILDFAPFTPRNIKGDDDLLGSDGQPVVFVLYSSGSKQGVRALHKAGQQSQMRLQAMLRNKASKNSAEEAEQEQVDKLVAFTKSISGNYPHTPEAIYANPRRGWLRRQIEEFISDDANFAKPAISNSETT